MDPPSPTSAPESLSRTTQNTRTCAATENRRWRCRVVQPVEAAAAEEVTVATSIAQEAEAVIVAVRDQRQEVIRLIARAARATLGEVARLLREDIHDTKILVADALAVVPALNDRDPRATLAVAAKLVASVFSEAPVLPGAIGAAMDLVASVYAVPPPVTGPLQEVRTVSDDHDRAGNLFADCRPYLGIETEAWTNHRSQALLNGYAAEMGLNRAIWEAGQALRVHRFYQVGPPQPHRGRRMKEAWNIIEEVDTVIASIVRMRYPIAGEIQIVRNAIHAAAL
uniref:Uncharacterized protein n=1 Tax=Oryza barthii TaxID=65489 RepID=A0A0D3FIV0_9ORYZ